jgi:hypothetical protein
MAARTDTPRPNGGGSVAETADFDARLAVPPVARADGPAGTQSDAIATLTHRLNRLTREASEYRQRGDELKASLEKRSRRVQQLIGERDRLSTLLAARDAELQRLNRKVGALAARAAPAERSSPALLTAACTMLERFRNARKAPVRARSTERQLPTTPPSAGRALMPWIKDGPPKAVLGVVVLGLSEAEIESVLDVVERYCAERDLAPLLFTDTDAFQLFRGRRVLFEFLPPRSEQERLARELDWRLYTLRRLALIRRKWQPVRVVAFGRMAGEVVQEWLESPFEATPVPALVKGRPEGPRSDWGGALQPEATHP